MARKKGDKDYTETEKQLLISMINDYEICDLMDVEMMEILSQKLGRRIKETTFYKLKKEANKNKLDSGQWLDNFVRFGGFFDFYKQRIEEVSLVQKQLVKLYVQEARKEDNDKDSKQDKHLMNKLAKTINDNSKILSEMGMGPPILAKLYSLIPKELLQGDLEFTQKYFENMDNNRKFLWSGNSSKNEGNNDDNGEIKINLCDAETALFPPIHGLEDTHSKKGTILSSDIKTTTEGDQRIF